MPGNLKYLPCALLLVVISAFHAHAAPPAALTVSGDGGTAYTVTGSGLENIGAIDLTLNYDASSLGTPAISKGSLISDAMMAANANNPGSISIAIISTKAISGSGQIVAITFASRNGSGGITSCSGTLTDSSGKPVSGPCTVAAGSVGTIPTVPGIPFSTAPTVAPAATPPPVTAGIPAATPSVVPVDPGTQNTTAGDRVTIDTKPVDAPVPAVQHTEPPVSAAVIPPVEEKKIVELPKPRELQMISPKAALESFRTYQGEKSPAILAALMTREIMPNIHQVPAVILSDGTTTVKILVKLASGDKESPNFALNGARLVTLGKDETAATWVIEALPQKNILQASLTILAGSEVIEYPLTLAPPVPDISPEEILFSVFLKDSGVVPPRRDLNGDGRHDYLDDYIYTANYLKLKGASGSPINR